jgi:hypothetical protein
MYDCVRRVPSWQCCSAPSRAVNIRVVTEWAQTSSRMVRCSYYDEPLLRRSFDGVEHDVIDLNDQAPASRPRRSSRSKMCRS